MKKIIYSLFISFFFFSAHAQKGNDAQNMKVITNSEPVFPKGDLALFAEVMYDTPYPEAAIKKYVEGEVTLSFDVKTDSTVSNIVLISGVGSGVDEEVKKMIAKLKFAPAIQNGISVKMNTMYSFPVKAH